MTRRTALLAIFAVLFTAAAWSSPIRNWDRIGYTAAYFAMRGAQGTDLFNRTYADVRQSVPQEELTQFILFDDDYQRTVATDPGALEQQVPFYRIRPMYIFLTSLLAGLTGSFAQATFGVAAIAAGLLLFISSRQLAETASLPILAGFVLIASGALLEVARLSTPDSLACPAAFLAILGLSKRHIRRSASLLVILPLIRTDYVLLSLLGAAYLAVLGNRSVTLATCAGAIAAYLAAISGGSHSYFKTFAFALIEGPHPYPATSLMEHPLSDYLRAYGRGALEFLKSPLLYIFASIAAILGTMPRIARENDTVVPLVLSAAFAILHFALFPAFWPRHFILFTLVYLLFLAKCLTVAGPGSMHDLVGALRARKAGPTNLH